ncbi:MAG TPA: hypothetical protein VKF84_18265 [Candidatus Sulfotelmatobacter sp.]|nr:hypothetical protein [Candidatus Sulfotelmatobacter sp.]
MKGTIQPDRPWKSGASAPRLGPLMMRLQPLRANVSIDHEQQLIRAFFVPAKRDRYIEMIASTRGRQKFLRELSHFKSLDPQYCAGLPNAVRTPGEIASFLNEKGAPPTCRVTSEDRDLDRQEMSLVEALKRIVGYQMGTFLSCLPGKLAYFEDEEHRWILERRD